MKDRRYVDELSIEELEEALRVRRREARLKRLEEKQGRFVDPLRPVPAPQPAPAEAPATRGRGRQYSAVIETDEKRAARRAIQWGWVWDRFLLLLEVLALIGVVAVAGQMILTMQEINAESRAAQAMPTPTPTPVIGAALLPGGHTPPDALGQSEPAPIPTHLQGLVAKITPLPAPTASPEQAQRIVIPAIGVDAPVVEGDDWETLKQGAGHRIGTANPGERGNCVISAHNDIYGEIFRDLPDLKVGDEIFVHTETQVYRYVVEQSRIIEPTEVSVMAPTSTPVLTLISCYPYGIDTHRIVVIGALEP
ncbi:MAG: sortase [Anaerolineales bacterium]